MQHLPYSQMKVGFVDSGTAIQTLASSHLNGSRQARSERKALMVRVIGVIVAVTVPTIMAINAVFMVASPRVWFRLPGWIKAQGSLTADKYSSGWGAIQVRITGALILGAIGWVLYDMFLSRG